MADTVTTVDQISSVLRKLVEEAVADHQWYAAGNDQPEALTRFIAAYAEKLAAITVAREQEIRKDQATIDHRKVRTLLANPRHLRRTIVDGHYYYQARDAAEKVTAVVLGPFAEPGTPTYSLDTGTWTRPEGPTDD